MTLDELITRLCELRRKVHHGRIPVHLDVTALVRQKDPSNFWEDVETHIERVSVDLTRTTITITAEEDTF